LPGPFSPWKSRIRVLALSAGLLAGWPIQGKGTDNLYRCDSALSPRQEIEMAFATCDRCRNAIVLGDEQAHQAYCPYCKVPLRITSREEFFARLRRADSEIRKESAMNDRSVEP
jgi:hypothetical protein